MLRSAFPRAEESYSKSSASRNFLCFFFSRLSSFGVLPGASAGAGAWACPGMLANGVPPLLSFFFRLLSAAVLEVDGACRPRRGTDVGAAAAGVGTLRFLPCEGGGTAGRGEEEELVESDVVVDSLSSGRKPVAGMLKRAVLPVL